MSATPDRKQQVLQLYKAAVDAAKAGQNSEIEQRLMAAGKQLSAGKLFVVVCGEFKRGKSSLINALLGEPGLFPVDVDIATSLVTTISHRAEERIVVAVGERGQEEKRPLARGEIADYVTEGRNPNNARQARLMAIETPNEKLKDGLILVDTPGVGGLQAGHNEVTYAFIPNADVVLFVSDALAPLTTEELAFVGRIAKHCPSILFVITKIDLKGSAERAAIIENNRAKLATVLGRRPEAIQILPVSNKMKLDYLRSGEEEDLEDSNFPAFEATLWTMLREQRGDVVLLHALTELVRNLTELQRPLQAESAALGDTAGADPREVERQLEEARQQLQHLAANNAEWRLQLTQGLQDIRAEMLANFQDGFVRIKRHNEGYLNDPQYVGNPLRLVGQLESEIDSLLTDLGRNIATATGELQVELEKNAGLALNAFEVGSLGWQSRSASLDWSRLKKGTLWERSLEMSKNGNQMGLQVGTIGMVVGGALGIFGGFAGVGFGAMIGSQLGRMAGMAISAKKDVSQGSLINRPEVARITAQFLDDSQRDCNRTLLQALVEQERAIQRDLQAQIARQKASCEQSIQSLQAARKLTSEQAGKRSSEVKTAQGRLDQIRSRAEALMGELMQQRDGAATAIIQLPAAAPATGA
ncbi:MAG: dynamin family protein [Thermomicrobiales bacterium]